MNILSIQSWVALGHVGNASAMFPLQRLGAEVSAIHTVQFSNHPGHGHFSGQVFEAAALTALLDGIEARGALGGFDAVLSGYAGAAATAELFIDAAARVRAANPRALWCCDPVMGDDAPGLYVRPAIVDIFRDQAVPAADLLTPNQFELRLLTGMPCGGLQDAKRAVGALQARMAATGPRAVLVTSLRTEETPDGSIDLLAAAGGGFFLLRTPKLPIAPHGAGDAIAALFLFHLLQGGDVTHALQQAGSAIWGLLRRTCEAGSAELLTVAAQDEFVRPSRIFVPQAC